MQTVCPFLFGALTAFAFATGSWAVWGLMTPGDYFANGNSLVYPSICVAIAIGAWIGYKARPAWLRALLLVAAFSALYFFVSVPDGWWASSPPVMVPKVQNPQQEQ